MCTLVKYLSTSKSNGDFANHFDADTQVTRHEVAKFIFDGKMKSVSAIFIPLNGFSVISQNCSCDKSLGPILFLMA